MNTKLLGRLFLILLLDVIAFSLFLPIMPTLIEAYNPKVPHYFHRLRSLFCLSDSCKSQQFDLVFWNGFVSSLYGICQCIVAPFHGRLMDRFGRRPMLFVSICASLLSYIIPLYLPTFEAFLASKLIAGTFKSLASLSSTIITDLTSAEDRSKGMAVIGIAYSLGFIIGPLLCATVVKKELVLTQPLTLAFYAYVVVAALSLTFPETKGYKPIDKNNQNVTADKKSTKEDGGYVWKEQASIYWISFFFLTFFSGLDSSIIIFLQDAFYFSPKDIGKLLTWMGFLAILFQGTIVRRKNVSIAFQKKLVQFGIFGGIITCITLPLVQKSIQAYVVVIGSALASSVVSNGLASLASFSAEPERKGYIMGKHRGFTQLGRAIGPFFSALVYSFAGRKASYALNAAGMCLCLLVFSRTCSTPVLPNSKNKTS